MRHAGGEFRLCWCSLAQDVAHDAGGVRLGQPTACRRPHEFGVDLGGLAVVGPSPLQQHRTCVSGQTCAVASIEGRYVSEADGFAVLDTCGAELGANASGWSAELAGGGWPQRGACARGAARSSRAGAYGQWGVGVR